MKTYTKALYGKEGRAALRRGMAEVIKPVAATMGAKGRNAVMRTWGMSVEPTNDGVQVARAVVLLDEFESMGADMIKQVAEKQNQGVGDGTTTAVVVTGAMIDEGDERLDEVHPMVLKGQLEQARDEAIQILKDMAKPLEDGDMLSVARISVEDEALAQIVADASEKAGQYGEVVVERGGGYTTEVDMLEGYHWQRGYFSPQMISNQRGEAEMNDCAVIITDKGLNLNNDLIGILGEILTNKVTNVLLVADRVEGELLSTLIANKQGGRMNVVAVGRPETAEELEDLAFLTRSTAVTKEKGIKSFAMGHVGEAKHVIASKDKTIVVGFDGPELQQRIADVKVLLEENPDDEVLKRRVAKLTSGIITIRVGAKTEAESKYIKDKVDDAVAACRAAREEGVVPGAGVALSIIASKMEDKTIGHEILRKALMKPFETILENAGIPNTGVAYNVLTGEQVKDEDMVSQGIMDPTKVERFALESAVSLTTMFLTTESVIAEFEVPQLQPGS